MSDTTTELTRVVDGVELPAPGVFTVDASHSHVGFTIRHLMVSKVRGTFDDFQATVDIADDPLASSVEVSIDAGSINTRDGQRDAHLRSADFFDVENHPTLAYRSKKVSSQGKGKYLVDGELTIRGVTIPVPLHVELEGVTADPWGNYRAGFSAKAEIDRDDFGLTWNQALDTGGFVLGKKVAIEIEAEAIRQPQP